jgi:hypothetical protein
VVLDDVALEMRLEEDAEALFEADQVDGAPIASPESGETRRRTASYAV